MRYRIALLLGLGVASPVPVTAQELPPPYARPLEFTFADRDVLRGELLAAQRDSLWILPSRGEVRVVALEALARVRGRHSGMTSGGMLLWATLGGLASGAALTAACATVDDAECAAVLPVTLALWWAVGGIAAAVTGSGRYTLPPTADALQPYTRFPQGLPPNFPLGDPRSPTPVAGDGARDMASTMISRQFPSAARKR